MIELENLRKSFRPGSALRRVIGRPLPPVDVLRGVDLTVERGDFLALLGANGAGKTTILKTIATLLLPDAGTVRVLGHDAVAEARRIRGQVGYVLADERSFHWRLGARENLEFFAALSGLHGPETRRRIDHLLDRLDLSRAGDRDFGAFSTGMKQRLAVARALLPRPRVLLMDEPTRSIDAAHAAEVWRLVRDQVEAVEGCVVLVTHQIQEALATCGRIALLADGQIALDTSSRQMGALTSELDGFTLAVRGLAARDLRVLEQHPGIRSVRVASQLAGEQTLELWTAGGDAPLAGFISELTALGATICSLQRATPLQGVLERLAVADGRTTEPREVPV
jgi:ABC-2 type transport system ATP-binding protein